MISAVIGSLLHLLEMLYIHAVLGDFKIHGLIPLLVSLHADGFQKLTLHVIQQRPPAEGV